VIALYNELYKAWRSEKSSRLPDHLPSDFYQRATNYLDGLQEDSSSGDSKAVQSRLVIREKEVARRLLDELRETRLRKILENAKIGISIAEENLTTEERTFMRNLSDLLATFRKNEIQIEDTSRAATRAELMVVRFLQEIPEIVGTDLRIYGPYKKEDVGSLPAENAQALIKQGAAKPIAVKGLS
jgi:DNA replication initiation complex subunit (GINS family)